MKKRFEKIKNVIPNYEITFTAKNVTPKQREFFYDVFESAYDELVKSKALTIEQVDDMTFGETKVSEIDWTDPNHWVGAQS